MKKIVFFLCSALLLSSAPLLGNTELTNTNQDYAFVKIKKGMVTSQIANLLLENGVIKSKRLFLFLSRATGKSKKFRHGTYLLKKDSTWDAISAISKGSTYKIKVSFPEGWSAYEVGLKLKRMEMIQDADAFLNRVREKNVEGLLFPETYFFDPDSSMETIINVMVRQYRKNFTDEFRKRAKELNLTEREVVTLASIIERETRIESERKTIASVYTNRLRKRMRLTADPTVQYALSNGKAWKKRLFHKHLKFKSPYNTYIHFGLPPGPICNPGLKSIEAALWPEKTDYLFFVSDAKGGHRFSKTLKQHNIYKQKFFRERRLQKLKKSKK